MKVVHISTSVSDSSANTRLHYALLAENIESKILVQGEFSNLDSVYRIGRKRDRYIREFFIGKIANKLLYKFFKLDRRIPFSTGLVGSDLKREKMILDADIIHLHWICNFQSILSIRSLLKLGKPIIWTCHDSWAFTGGCHVRLGCDNFMKSCGHCKYQKSHMNFDFSNLIFILKKTIWKNNNIKFIAPSNWMKESINKSALFKNNEAIVIPNAIDTATFFKFNNDTIYDLIQYKSDERINVLFGAEFLNSSYKGIEYLIKAFLKLKEDYPEIGDRLTLHIIGNKNNFNNPLTKLFKCIHWDYVTDTSKIVALYSLADLYLHPSLDDNLPNMIMESMSCETPVVAFNIGGVSDLIRHKNNGYLAKYKDTDDFLDGILWVLNNNQEGEMGKQCRQWVLENYSFHKIAYEHIKYYETALLSEKN